jgi:hypothetical protein
LTCRAAGTTPTANRVASALVAQSMQTPWVENHMEGGGERPTVIVGEIRNKTPEHIPMKTLVADLERSFINSRTGAGGGLGRGA